MADYKYTANTQFSTAQFSRKVDTEVNSQTSSLQKQIKEINDVLQEKKKKSDEINKQINEFEMNLMQNTASKLTEQWKKNIASLRDQFNTLAKEQDNLTEQREQAEQQIIDVQLEGEKKKQEFFNRRWALEYREASAADKAQLLSLRARESERRRNLELNIAAELEGQQNLTEAQRRRLEQAKKNAAELAASARKDEELSQAIKTNNQKKILSNEKSLSKLLLDEAEKHGKKKQKYAEKVKNLEAEYLEMQEEGASAEDLANKEKDIKDAKSKVAQQDGLENLFKTLKKTAEKLAESAEKAIDNAVETAGQYTASINTRLQGTDNTYKKIQAMVGRNMALSGQAKSEDVIKNIKELIDKGIAYNIEERAYIQTISDKIASTFNAFDASLLRIIRIEQADSTQARAGIVSFLNLALNKWYQDTSYLTDSFKNVTDALLEASSQLSRDQSVAFEYMVQKWLGSLGSLGVAESTITNIAQSIGYLSSGNISALSSGNQQILLALSASRAGVDYAKALTSGLTPDETNKLLRSMVEYLREIAQSNNNVVKSQYGTILNVTLSDLKAISNLTNADINNIFSTNLSYSQAKQRYQKQVASLYSRMDMTSILNTAYANILYTIGQNIGSSPFMNATWKINSLIEDATGGINIPAVGVLGNFFEANANVNQIIKLGLVGVSTLKYVGQMIKSLANQKAGGNWGSIDVLQRGSASISIDSGITEGESYAGYIGNESGDDAYNSALKQVTEQGKETSKTTNADVATNKTAADIYNALFVEQKVAVKVCIADIDKKAFDKAFDDAIPVVVKNNYFDQMIQDSVFRRGDY